MTAFVGAVSHGERRLPRRGQTVFWAGTAGRRSVRMRPSLIDPVLPVATVQYQEFYSLSGSHIANLGRSAPRWIAEEYNR
jgi:hypothetical protein